MCLDCDLNGFRKLPSGMMGARAAAQLFVSWLHNLRWADWIAFIARLQDSGRAFGEHPFWLHERETHTRIEWTRHSIEESQQAKSHDVTTTCSGYVSGMFCPKIQPPPTVFHNMGKMLCRRTKERREDSSENRRQWHFPLKDWRMSTQKRVACPGETGPVPRPGPRSRPHTGSATYPEISWLVTNHPGPVPDWSGWDPSYVSGPVPNPHCSIWAALSPRFYCWPDWVGWYYILEFLGPLADLESDYIFQQDNTLFALADTHAHRQHTLVLKGAGNFEAQKMWQMHLKQNTRIHTHSYPANAFVHFKFKSELQGRVWWSCKEGVEVLICVCLLLLPILLVQSRFKCICHLRRASKLPTPTFFIPMLLMVSHFKWNVLKLPTPMQTDEVCKMCVCVPLNKVNNLVTWPVGD